MRRVVVIGAGGFFGSALADLLAVRPGIELVRVARATYVEYAGRQADVVIDCSGNSRKYLADESPLEEFDRSVTQRLRTLLDFPARMQVHVSSVDVYNDLSSPETTREDRPIDPELCSRYGLHKWLAEQLVRSYAPRWLIVRLAGMVGPGLLKNPVHDILRGQPLRLHPDSRYQFMNTADAARILWQLVENGLAGRIVNVCGDGTLSPREIAALAGRELDLGLVTPGMEPRVVDVCIDSLRGLMAVPSSEATLRAFLASQWDPAMSGTRTGPPGATA